MRLLTLKLNYGTTMSSSKTESVVRLVVGHHQVNIRLQQVCIRQVGIQIIKKYPKVTKSNQKYPKVPKSTKKVPKSTQKYQKVPSSRSVVGYQQVDMLKVHSFMVKSLRVGEWVGGWPLRLYCQLQVQLLLLLELELDLGA